MNGQLTVYDKFERELQERADKIVSQLPSNVNRQRFIDSTIAAIKQNPELLKATPRSLFSAITKSAQDGLLPDGKEGVITIYKQKNRETQQWEPHAQWNPMVWGLRKRARELDGIIINAQVVYQGDEFSREEGDDPKIVHKPATLGQARGPMIGAYAIFKNDSGILHREVMDKDEIEAVRSQSKQQDGLLWTKFVTEAWRKSVVRRGIKSVPCSEKLEAIAHRDDDSFEFDVKPKTERIEGPKPGEQKALPPVVGQPIDTTSVNVTETGTMEAEYGNDTITESEDPAPPQTAKPLPPPAGNGKAKKAPAKKAAPAPVSDGAPDPVHEGAAFSAWAQAKMNACKSAADLGTFWAKSIDPRKADIFPGDFNELMSCNLKRASDIASDSMGAMA